MIKQLSREVKMSRNDIKAYREQFGPRQLSQVERQKVEQFLAILNKRSDDEVEDLMRILNVSKMHFLS